MSYFFTALGELQGADGDGSDGKILPCRAKQSSIVSIPNRGTAFGPTGDRTSAVQPKLI
ncbi:hypothetical protein [Methylocaldum sp.]|uniref:hypothetical protein n=1 Tax=Methylocaldum sp. TaxID=1969727 RepID=UPI002D403F0E|nr:hypothetical protein [Methylocaldum sp.]HYE36517.1 hypothetical protein [Methylocaldum sp.]